METYELKTVYDRAKSFYGKATVTVIKGAKLLRSYQTDVALIDQAGALHRLWYGESRTTLRHVSEFARQNGLDGLGVADWRELPVERFDWINFYCTVA